MSNSPTHGHNAQTDTSVARTLVVYPNHALAQAHMANHAIQSPYGVCLGSNGMALQDLEQRIIQDLLGTHTVVLSNLEERCWLRVLAASDVLKHVYHPNVTDRPRFVDVLQSALHYCHALGLTPQRLKELGKTKSSPHHTQLTALAHVFFHWEKFLQENGVWSQHTALLEVISRFATNAEVPNTLRHQERLIFKYAYQLSPLQIRFIEAIGTRLGPSVECVIEIPHHEGSSRYFRKTAHLLEQLEKTGDQLATTVLPTSPLNPSDIGSLLLHALMKEPAAPEVPWSRIAIHESSSPFQERLAVVEQVHQWIGQGIAPEEIVVAVRTIDEETQLLRLALEDSGLSVLPVLRSALSASSLLRWFIQILALSYQPWNKETVMALLASHYAGSLRHGEAQAIIRGFSAVLPPAETTPDALIGACKQYESTHSNTCAEALKALAKVLAPLTVPQQLSTFVEHTRTLMTQCRIHHNMPLPARTRQELRTLILAEDPLSVEVSLAMGREELGIDALEHVLSQLELLGTRLTHTLKPEVYWHMLTDALNSHKIHPPGPRNGAVKILGVHQLVGMRFDAIIIPELVDGRFPAPSRPSALLPMLDPRKLSLRQSHVPDAKEPTLEEVQWLQFQHEEEALLFALSINAAKSHVALSYSAYDTAGRETLPALFVQECIALAHVADQSSRIHKHPDEPLPTIEHAYGKERFSRAATSALYPASLGQFIHDLAKDEPPKHTLYDDIPGLELPSVLRRAHIERQRLAHAYSKGKLYHTPYTGCLRDHLDDVPQHLPGSKEHPLSPSQLETAARCPFQDFATRVLKLRPKKAPQYDMEPKEDGQLAHRCFEAAMKAIIDQNLGSYRPENYPAAQGIALAAIDAVLKQHPERHSMPTALFEHHAKAIRDKLLALLEHMYNENENFSPSSPELTFAEGSEWPAIKLTTSNSEAPLWIHGRIDLMETDGTIWRATDLKRQRKSRLTQQMTPKTLGQTSLQLPIYAVACHAKYPEKLHDARYLSLKDGKALSSLRTHMETNQGWKKDDRSLDDLLTLTTPEGTLTSLGITLTTLAEKMRSNTYALEPIEGACERCDFTALCRIPRTDIAEVPDSP